MPVKNIEEIRRKFANISKVTEGNTASGLSKMSLTVVYNRNGNGKRITLTKSLASAIGIDNSVDLLPIPDEGVVFLAKKLPYPQAITRSLRGKDGHKISYAAQVVALLIECFSLDFKGHVSQTYQDIRIDKLPDGSPLAIVNMLNPKPYADVFDTSASDAEADAEVEEEA